MSQQFTWGSSSQHQNGRRLTPISTAFTSSQRHTPSPSSPSRAGFSPATSGFPSLPPPSSRHVASRNSSASSTSSPFSPSHAGQQPPPNQLLSSTRSRTIAPPTTSQLASSAATLPTASQGGGTPSSGGGATKLARASPSLSQSSAVGSPITTTNPTSTPSGQSLSKIVIAQVFLLLSQFGSIKEDKDKAKWETQADQIRKLIDSNGMEVFSKYFRRLLQGNAGQIFPGAGRSSENSGSYSLLVSEMQKIRHDPQQASKIAESVDTPEGDLFRDFDLSTFMSHFKLDPVAKTTLALAFKNASKPDLRTKADAILSNNYQEFIMTIAHPPADGSDDLPSNYLANVIDRLIQDPPRDWNDETKHNLSYALSLRHQTLGIAMSAEISASLHLLQLSDATQYPLIKMVQRAGPRATATLESCKEMLASAETRDISYQQVACVLLFMVITQNGLAYNASIFVAALREHHAGQHLDWQDVVHAFDRDGLRVTKRQFLALYQALFPLATENEKFDIQLLWGGLWANEMTQLSFIVAFLSCTPDELDASQIPRLRRSFTTELFEGSSEEVKNYAERAAKHPLVSLDATTALFNMIFRSQETYNNAQTLGIPELVINANTDIFVVSAAAVSKPWGALQEQAMKQLYFPFLTKKLPQYNFVLYGLWKQDVTWLVSKFVEAYNSDQMTLLFIMEHAQANGWLEPLIGVNNDLSLDMVALAHARGLFEIEPWAQQAFQEVGVHFRRALTHFLILKAEFEIQSQRDPPPTSVPLAVKTVHQLLWFLGDIGLPETELLSLQRSCIQAYPRLINYGEDRDEVIDSNGKDGNGLPEEADKRMQEHYKNMYSGDSDVRDIIEILRGYKTSEDPFEQDLFACMIHGLFDEYNCFSEYPLEALATTAVLFGGIINYNLLSRIALQVGLKMVLEAVQEYRPEESMYKFGLQALLHFSNRLQEWPNFCDQLLTVPHLQGTEIWAKAEEIVGHQLGEMNGETQNGAGMANGTNVDDLLQAESSVPHFTCLHVDPPLRQDLYEEPDEDVQDKVLFVLNNVSERNLKDKIKDLMDALEEKHHQWFAGYLVEERAKMQPNFQQLYLDMLDLFDDKMLWAEVLRQTYAAVIRMLNAESTLNSSTERAHLKNLGGWLGSLTIARDKPIKFKNISFKDLLIEGYDTDRLLLVIPFTCKVLVQAAKSKVFKPPNPWIVEIVKVLLELYKFADLKLNQKFEIEVLCKGLDLDHTQIEPSDSIRSRPQPEEEFLGPIVTDGMEAFSDLSIMSLNRVRGPSERFSPAAITATLPDFSSQLIYPPSGSNLVAQNTLRKIFLSAAQQAIQEIIAPVVERSVTIAAISTSQLVAKDFAMEPDEHRLRDAAHTVVKSLSGALALVTCKEPLRMSIMNNIRLMARDLPEQALPEGHVLMFVNDNLDTVCSMVEQAAEIQSLPEIDMQIDEAVRMRQRWRNVRPTEPYKEGHISNWAFYIPDPYKQTVGGLNREQLAIYEEFGRQTRGIIPHATTASQESGRQVPDVLQDQFAAVPNLPTPAEAPAVPRQTGQQPSRLQTLPSAHIPPAQQQLNGYMEPAIPDRGQRVEDLLNELQRSAKEAPEEHIDDLRPTAPTYHIFEQLIATIESAGPQKGHLALAAAGRVTTCIFSDSESRLEIEVMTHLLASLCQLSIDTSKQVIVWLATIEDDRVFNAVVIVCLISVGLMDLHRINITCAKAIQRRSVIAVEFLSNLMDEILLNEHPTAFRADFALSVDALTQWLAEDPDLEIGKQVAGKLQILPTDQGLHTPPPTSKKDQLSYIFDEWVHLQYPDTPQKSIAAFVNQMHQMKILDTPEHITELLRVCIEASVDSYEREETLPFGTRNLDAAYINVDALAKLIVCLVIYHGEEDGAVKENKAKYLDAILCLVILFLCNHHHTRGERFNQKVFFRLFSTILSELHVAAKDNALAGFKTDIFLVIGKAFLALQPRYLPLFSYSWLGLIAHRIFIPAFLDEDHHDLVAKDRRWDLYTQLMEALLRYTGELIKPVGGSVISQNFYRGVLRVLLVIHHDYPEFLAENHFRLCNSIPMHCTQVRNLIVSAYPSTILEMPDPFSAGLKVDRLEEIRQTPNIRGDIEKPILEAGIKDTIDNLLRVADQSAEDIERVCKASYYPEPKPSGFELVPTSADPILLNAIVLYIGSTALAIQGSKGPTFNSTSPPAKLLERLAKELRPEARYHFVSAIANQLRWPNSHTHYFSYAVLHLFGSPSTDQQVLDVQQTITRVLLERLLVHRPHPWGLIITLLEVLKNRTYAFWELPFVKAAPEVERLFTALFSHVQQSPRPLV
ncbi:Not1-domain-containing protein [Lepidopterella palustris CBS 459.81]|uniref:General negative regulator of transcription subunit 1 n=1 Tax=Lepidopterella palustris CBS 459.81 TaxID=1314670 RepID=A0A8E2E757_9PEZI|nr:Not1-domain-containing protein [Lepidopterella palustris CBS 459.81]